MICQLFNVCKPGCLILASLLAAAVAHQANGELFQRDGEMIPNTEGLALQSGAQLDNLSLQNLDAKFASLGNATFESSDLTGAWFYAAQLRGTNFTNATVNGALLGPISKEQFYSTASYKSGDLSGVILDQQHQGWDLASKNLESAVLAGEFANASLRGANLNKAQLSGGYENVDFSDASIAGASINYSTISAEQLYSTASYKSRDLVGLKLASVFPFVQFNANGWDFSGQNLTRSELGFVSGVASDFTNAQMGGTVADTANLTRASLTNSQLANASFFKATLVEADLSGASLLGTDLRGASLAGAVFRGANLQNASLFLTTGLDSDSFDANTIVNQWTVFPDGFDATEAGFVVNRSLAGDFNADDLLNIEDINLLSARLLRGDNVLERTIEVRGTDIYLDGGAIIYEFETEYDRDVALIGLRDDDNDEWLEPMFDLNGDKTVDSGDLAEWLSTGGNANVGRPYLSGDTNLDGAVNSADLNVVGLNWQTSTQGGWTSGDLNSDGFVDVEDLNELGKNWGSTASLAAVPEPNALALLLLAAMMVSIAARRQSPSRNLI